MNKAIEILKNIFLPRNLTCSCCGRESFTGGILCEDCLGNTERNDGYICEHCGVKTPLPAAYCDRCKNRLTFFDKARSVYLYGEVTAILVQKLKYGGAKYLAEEFAKEIYKLFVSSVTYADGIVCVPMSEKREKARGYNQSKLIAEKVAELSGAPFLDVTVKRKETESQVGKTYGERRKNLDGSFGIKEKSLVRGKRIVIVDDVSTTGTTADMLAAALKNAGASEVFALTYASVERRTDFLRDEKSRKVNKFPSERNFTDDNSSSEQKFADNSPSEQEFADNSPSGEENAAIEGKTVG